MSLKFFTNEITINKFNTIEDYNNKIDNPSADGDRYYTNYGFYELFGTYKNDVYGIEEIAVYISPYFKEIENNVILNDLKLKLEKDFYVKKNTEN